MSKRVIRLVLILALVANACAPANEKPGSITTPPQPPPVAYNTAPEPPSPEMQQKQKPIEAHDSVAPGGAASGRSWLNLDCK